MGYAVILAGVDLRRRREPRRPVARIIAVELGSGTADGVGGFATPASGEELAGNAAPWIPTLKSMIP